ncbi:competence protein comGG [Anoxybacillus sp. LAT_35]|uniref:competence type IV pilus minor pilin ComGG n=1 Tax=Anoxybacillus TaxID=150247 RepID=UPI001EDB8075|nr:MULTISPECIES: competence type IV pilus minor pilin ComGG [Anoxybacillus]MCG5024296.1 competence protein comGG [Anoxybacillus flavithermus]MCG6198312.1 competence protein comGG [Anoxybacillus sp. LAT_38]MCG3085752.1 competence protein comGG [Anoxybacillus sp. LAT27]MCG6171924.1 competence protein comGG [Anoxybacillus sp. LAT_11]MCG6174276.1 competence protein comGG [Anoxybacillus sp. LAT_31]
MKRSFHLFISLKYERGVIFLFTVMCALFMSALFLHAVALYHTEIQFFEEEKKGYEADYLMKQALIYVKQTLASTPENVSSLTQTVSFVHGQATYRATRIEPDVWSVTVSCITNAQFRYDVQFQFNASTNNISVWREVY